MENLDQNILAIKDFLNSMHENDQIAYNLYSQLFDLVDNLNEFLPESLDSNPEEASAESQE